MRGRTGSPVRSRKLSCNNSLPSSLSTVHRSVPIRPLAAKGYCPVSARTLQSPYWKGWDLLCWRPFLYWRHWYNIPSYRTRSPHCPPWLSWHPLASSGYLSKEGCRWGSHQGSSSTNIWHRSIVGCGWEALPRPTDSSGSSTVPCSRNNSHRGRKNQARQFLP